MFVAFVGVVVSSIAAAIGVASFVDDFHFVVAATMMFFIGF